MVLLERPLEPSGSGGFSLSRPPSRLPIDACVRPSAEKFGLAREAHPLQLTVSRAWR